jgi:hypothetical protein
MSQDSGVGDPIPSSMQILPSSSGLLLRLPEKVPESLWSLCYLLGGMLVHFSPLAALQEDGPIHPGEPHTPAMRPPETGPDSATATKVTPSPPQPWQITM